MSVNMAKKKETWLHNLGASRWNNIIQRIRVQMIDKKLDVVKGISDAGKINMNHNYRIALI